MSDEQRFANISKAKGFDGEMARAFQAASGFEETAEGLVEDIGEDHIPRFVLIGIGGGATWGEFRFVDDLLLVPYEAVDMKDWSEEVSAVCVSDLDNPSASIDGTGINGLDDGVYSQEEWYDYWDEED